MTLTDAIEGEMAPREYARIQSSRLGGDDFLIGLFEPGDAEERDFSPDGDDRSLARRYQKVPSR